MLSKQRQKGFAVLEITLAIGISGGIINSTHPSFRSMQEPAGTEEQNAKDCEDKQDSHEATQTATDPESAKPPEES